MRSLVLSAAILSLAMTAYSQVPPPSRPAPVQRIPPKLVYDESADAKADIAKALMQAQGDHKRLLLVFGGNWCGDCQTLDKRFHEPPAASIIGANFIVIHVDIGRADKNLDLAKKYGIPLEKGVPAIAVLESDGALIYSQRNGEFEPATRMDPQVFIDFLNKWKPAVNR
jgi:thiol-disulfide isomerase/thioredoxin